MENKEIELLDGTDEVEFISLKQLAQVYVDNVKKDCNPHGMAIKESYIVISSPSLKNNYCTRRKTLVYKIYNYKKFIQEELPLLLNDIASLSMEKGYDEAIEDIEKLIKL